MKNYKVKEREVAVLLKDKSDLSINNVLNMLNSKVRDINDFYTQMNNRILPAWLDELGYGPNYDHTNPFLGDNDFDHLYPIKITFWINDEEDATIRNIFGGFYCDPMYYKEKGDKVKTVDSFRKYMDKVIKQLKANPETKIELCQTTK